MAKGFQDFDTLFWTYFNGFLGFESFLLFVVLSFHLIKDSLIGCEYHLFNWFNCLISKLIIYMNLTSRMT